LIQPGKHFSPTLVLALVGLQVMPGCASMRAQLTQNDVAAFSSDIAQAAAYQAEPINGAIDVYDAIARAIKYNTDIRVKELEVTVAEADARLQNASLLPNLVADSSYYSRDGNRSGYNALPNSPGLSNGLSLSWDILDFGLSCVRAGQSADKALYHAEDLRRTALRIAEETRLAYWRAVALERLNRRLAAIDPEINAALKASDLEAKDPAMDPIAALSVSRDILTSQREINQLRAGLSGSLEQLKQLINVPPGQSVKLKDSRRTEFQTHRLLDTGEAVSIALENRAEVRQLMYQLRITDDEVNAQLLQVLPGVSLQTGLTNASLTTVSSANWIGWGAKAAWHLMNLLRLPVSMDAIDSQKELLRQQALAMAVSISMQVHIASAQYGLERQSLSDSERLLSVQKQLERHESAAAAVGQASGQSLAKERIATVLADARRGLAYAGLESAYGTYLTSLGVDVLDMSRIHDDSVNELADVLRHEAGRVPEPRHAEPDMARKTAEAGATKL
jgi:outer membrane protein TolC